MSKKKDPSVIEHDVYKHTHHSILAEQIILDNKSCFLQIIDNKPVIVDRLELPSQNIILHPRDRHKISSRIHQFKFNDENEISTFIEKAKSITIDDLYYQCKAFWEKLVVADEDEIILLSADTIFTFFQDRFVQTHYIMVIGPPGSGKNAIFLTLKFLGYRVVISSNMRSAHILDLLGSTEPCQITLIEDEFYDIYKDAEKLTIYITGYESDGVTSRTVDAGKPTRHPVDYNTFCLKLVGAEYPPKANERHGLEDRSFQINTHKGIPQYYVKNLMLKKPPAEYRKLLAEMEEFHKLMLIYRMIHVDDDIDISKTNIDTRALELSGPLINLFSAATLSPNKRARPEILDTLSVFLKKKGKLGQITLEYIIYQVIKDYSNNSKEDIIIISNPDLAKAVREKADGKPILSQEAFYSTILGRITHARIYERCRTMLGAEDASTGTGKDKKRGLLFTKQKIAKAESQFRVVDKIQILNNDNVDKDTNSSNIKTNNDSGTLGQVFAPTEHRNNVCPTDTSQSPVSGVCLENAIIDNNNKTGVIEAVQTQLDPVRESNAATQLNDGIFYKPKVVPMFHVEEILGTYVAWDLEWNAHNEITAAAFYDSNNNSCVYLREDFNYSEYALLEAIITKLREYSVSIGWYTTGRQGLKDGVNSDLMHLHERCIENGLDSIVNFWPNGQPIGIDGQTHIDLCVVYDNKMIKDTVYKISYFNKKLGNTAKILLGEEKYKSLSGDSFNYLSAEEKRKYVLQDAALVMKLSKHGNYKVLDLMLAISELCELSFDYVCMTSLSKWWEKIYNKMIKDGECGLPTKTYDNSKGTKPKGGKVFQPTYGFYNNPIIVIDAKSLYPSVAILYNISFDTVNCECCKDILERRITEPLVLQDCRFEKDYWICESDGTLKSKLLIFREERFKQIELGNESKQAVLKILINGAYGLFAYRYFGYRDPRVAELITAYGRFTLLKMKDLAQSMGFTALYGDTDSLFISISNEVDASGFATYFKEKCREQLHVDVDLKRIYDRFFLSHGKKHYIGSSNQLKEPEVVGMEGKKSNTPKFIRRVFKTIVSKIFNGSDIDFEEITSLLRVAMRKLENYTAEIKPLELIHAQKLGKDPEDYKGENHPMRKRGLALGLKKGDVVEVYESDNKDKFSKDPTEISVKWYKQCLWNVTSELLATAGFPVDQLAVEFGIKVKKQKRKDGHDNAQPSRGVAELSNVQQLKQTTVKGGVF